MIIDKSDRAIQYRAIHRMIAGKHAGTIVRLHELAQDQRELRAAKRFISSLNPPLRREPGAQ